MSTEKITISTGDGQVSGILQLPKGCKALLVLGHGAGAGMNHIFMEQLAGDLKENGIGSLRYNFPYIEAGRRSPNAPRISQDTVRAAVQEARSRFPEIPLLAGGKSYGGRMSSQAQSEMAMDGVVGLVFFGFPLHAPGRPGDQRGEHLKNIEIPMLFLQGSRDKLADLTLMKPLCQALGQRATLSVIEGADHGFSMLKSSTITTEQARYGLARSTRLWYDKL